MEFYSPPNQIRFFPLALVCLFQFTRDFGYTNHNALDHGNMRREEIMKVERWKMNYLSSENMSVAVDGPVTNAPGNQALATWPRRYLFG